MHLHEDVLPLGALCWAAAGKDPGFTPPMLLDLLGRRGHYRPADFERLHRVEPVDLVRLKVQRLQMLEDARAFVASRPGDQLGCLYVADGGFVQPQPGDRVDLHFGGPGGMLPPLA